MIHIAVAVLRFQLAQPRRQIAARNADIPRIAVKFCAIHTPIGVGRVSATAIVARLDGGFLIRRDTDL